MNERIEEIYGKNFHKFAGLEIMAGALYIVSTPIGNLEDISFRAIFILKNADIIACEDTRNTNFLLQQYEIKNKTVSYYSHVESAKIKYLTDELKSGKSVALVSDAGTPCISDPGNLLVSACIEEGIEIFSVPGCSSMMNALILSGFSTKKFYFQGFLPQKKGRQSALQNLKKIKMTIIIFESPYRILKTLKEISDVFGNAEICISRELTKKFEQSIRGSVKDILEKGFKIKGEFVITVNNH